MQIDRYSPRVLAIGGRGRRTEYSIALCISFRCWCRVHRYYLAAAFGGGLLAACTAAGVAASLYG